MPEYVEVGTAPSRRNPTERYTVKRNLQTNQLTCNCQGWIYSKRDPKSCRHTLLFTQLLSDEPVSPGDIRVVPGQDFVPQTASQVDATNQTLYGTTRPPKGTFPTETPKTPPLSTVELLAKQRAARAKLRKKAIVVEGLKSAADLMRSRSTTITTPPTVRVRSITFEED